MNKNGSKLIDRIAEIFGECINNQILRKKWSLFTIIFILWSAIASFKSGKSTIKDLAKAT